LSLKAVTGSISLFLYPSSRDFGFVEASRRVERCFPIGGKGSGFYDLIADGIAH
jgi:hypothetical protein